MKRREFLRYLAIFVGLLFGTLGYIRFREYKERENIENFTKKIIDKIKTFFNKNRFIQKEYFKKEEEFLSGNEKKIYNINGNLYFYLKPNKINKKVMLFSFLLDLGRICEEYNITSFEELESVLENCDNFIFKKLKENLDLFITRGKLDYGISIFIPPLFINNNKDEESSVFHFLFLLFSFLRNLYKNTKNKEFINSFGVIIQQNKVCININAFIKITKIFYKFGIKPSKDFIWRVCLCYDPLNKKYLKLVDTPGFLEYVKYPETLEFLNYVKKSKEILKKYLNDKNEFSEEQYKKIYIKLITQFLNNYKIFLEKMLSELITTKSKKKNTIIYS